MQFFITKNGQQFGPFEESKIAEMLRQGQLSPNDLGYRQGDGKWAALGSLVPEVSPDINPVISAAAPAISQTKKPGGCLKIFGVFLILGGLFFLIGGTGGTIASFFLTQRQPPLICKMADQAEQESDRALKEYEKAKGTPAEADKERNAKTSIEQFGRTSKACAEARATYRMWFIIFIVFGVFGFVGTAVGVLIRRI